MEWNNIGGKATQALRNEKARIVRDEDFQIAFISGFVWDRHQFIKSRLDSTLCTSTTVVDTD